MPSLLVPPVQTVLWLAGQQAAVQAAGGRRPPGILAGTVGGAAITAGAAAGLHALGTFTRRGTTWHPWAPERAAVLVTDGANSVSRNPMYLGLALGLRPPPE